MGELLTSLAPHFFQVAYVVPEIEAGERWFMQTLGVKKFTRLANVEIGEGCEYRGRPADYAAHLSLGYMNDVQIELIENVRGESLYSEFLAKRGPGLHHLGFLVPDFDATLDELQRSGAELATRGSLGSGNHFAYFDCEGPGFSVIEILGFDEAARGFMQALREQGK